MRVIIRNSFKWTEESLLNLAQSPAACLYYHSSKQGFACQYGLWLNCLEHSIYQKIDGLQAVLLNPDPTGFAPKHIHDSAILTGIGVDLW